MKTCQSRVNSRSLLLALATLVAALPDVAAAADPPVAKTKILLIGHDKDEHPFETHEYMSVCTLLAKCLRQTPGVETVISNRWPQNTADAADVDAIVLYLPWGSNILFDGPQRGHFRFACHGHPCSRV